jgi:hypothetical protein
VDIQKVPSHRTLSTVDCISGHAGPTVPAGVRLGVRASPTWRMVTDFGQWTLRLRHQSSLPSDDPFLVFSTGTKAMPMTLLYTNHGQPL